jgi:hypothetical protein
MGGMTIERRAESTPGRARARAGFVPSPTAEEIARRARAVDDILEMRSRMGPIRMTLQELMEGAEEDA